jgi:hypothetical protein
MGIHHGQAGGPRRLGCLTTEEITKITITPGLGGTFLHYYERIALFRAGWVRGATAFRAEARETPLLIKRYQASTT